MNLAHFAERARQSGDISEATLTAGAFQAMLEARIEALEVNSARQDVVRFIKTPTQLDIWSRDYFLQFARMIRLQ